MWVKFEHNRRVNITPSLTHSSFVVALIVAVVVFAVVAVVVVVESC